MNPASLVLGLVLIGVALFLPKSPLLWVAIGVGAGWGIYHLVKEVRHRRAKKVAEEASTETITIIIETPQGAALVEEKVPLTKIVTTPEGKTEVVTPEVPPPTITPLSQADLQAEVARRMANRQYFVRTKENPNVLKLTTLPKTVEEPPRVTREIVVPPPVAIKPPTPTQPKPVVVAPPAVAIKPPTVVVTPSAPAGSDKIVGEIGSKMTRAEAEEMLREHNRRRREVGTTSIDQHMPVPNPPISPLEWDPELAAYAQNWADTMLAEGRMYHSKAKLPDGRRVGENIAFDSGFNASAADKVVDWADSEVPFYTYEDGSCVPGEQCGHYSAIIWRDTSRVGCGVAREGNTQYWSCNFMKPGNWHGRKAY